MPVPTRRDDRHDPSGRPVRSDPTSFDRVRLNLILLCVGLAGSATVAWTMRDSDASSEVVGERLGMQRVANHWDGILAILAVPALLFFVILSIWSLSELYRGYRAANDPDHYRRQRRARRDRRAPRS